MPTASTLSRPLPKLYCPSFFFIQRLVMTLSPLTTLSVKEKDSLSLLTETYTSSTKYQGKVYLQVVFTSDVTNSKSGFVASWRSIETIIVATLLPTVRCSAVVTCGGTCGFCPGVAVTAGLSGNFSSGSYRNRDNCWWLITAPKDSETTAGGSLPPLRTQ